MRFHSLTKWKNVEDLAGLLFFSQRAEELLFDYTLDTYKPSALNPSSLCQEALRLLNDIESGLIDRKNLIPIFEELAWAISRDPVAKSLLDLPSEKYLLDPENEKPDSIRLKLEVLGRTLAPYRYLKRCYDLLSEAVRKEQKCQIDLISRVLFTTLINIGIHKTHLYEKTIGFFYQGSHPATIDNVDIIDDYLEYIFPYIHDFQVFFITSDLIGDVSESISAFGIEIHDELPEKLGTFSTYNGFCCGENEKFVEVQDIQAFDCYSARERGEYRIGQLRDLFTLSHHKTQISWKEETLIQQCCTDELRLVKLQKSPMEKGYDLKPEQASQRLNMMIKNLGLTKRDFQKFNKSVDFHGLSVNSSNSENQLLNLWIAIETIVPIHAGNVKIRQIIDGLVPFLSMNYMARILRQLASDMFRWNRQEVKRLLQTVPAPPRTRLINKVFLFLTLPECKPARKSLYANLQDFHLLRFRIFSLSASLSKPQKVLKLIETHEMKVKWQIRRIYRTRNLIVHSGHIPPYIQTLIENGHEYLDQTLLTITKMSISSYSVRTIAQGFELASVARRKIENNLRKAKDYDTEKVSVIMNEHEFVQYDDRLDDKS